MKCLMKGEIPLEYLLVILLIISALVPIVNYSLDIAELTIRTSKSKQVVNDIAAAADRLYRSGGGKTTITIDVPSGVDSYHLENNAIVLSLLFGDETGDAVATTLANVTGDITKSSGKQELVLEYRNGLVYINPAPGPVDNEPPTINLTGPPNNTINGSSFIRFSYITNDTLSGIESCSLVINSSLNQTDYSIIEETEQYFIVDFGDGSNDGDYNWQIRCIDNSVNNNIGFSIKYNLTVKTGYIPYEDVLVVYFNSTESTRASYRLWNGYSLSKEMKGPEIGTAANGHYILASSPKKQESILLFTTKKNELYMQVWNGTNWSYSKSIAENITQFRPYDVVYEQNSGDALIVFRGSQKNEPSYILWNGTKASTETVIPVAKNVSFMKWISIEPKPNTDEIAMVVIDNSSYVNAFLWDGDIRGNQLTLENETEPNANQTADVAYEYNSKKAVFVWADNAQTNLSYRTWDGKWSAEKQTKSIGSSSVYWLKLASDPASNNIVFAALDVGADLNSQMWNGSEWGNNTEFTSNVDTNVRKAFDIVFEPLSGRGILVYAERNSIYPKYRFWNTTNWTIAYNAVSVGGYQTWISLARNPIKNEVFMILKERINNQTSVQLWDNTTWGNYETVSNITDSAKENIAVSYNHE